MEAPAAPLRSLFLRHYLLAGFVVAAALALGGGKSNPDGVIWSDAEGYYLYLPAVFIYGGFENVPVRTTVQFSRYPGTDKYFTKYTCGVAMMELPFFLAAHLAAGITGRPRDGYGSFYVGGILLAAISYAFLGFFFLRRVLERRFSPGVTLLTITCLLLGTNMYFYIVKEPGTSHIFSFFLFCLLMYLTPAFYRAPSAGRIIGMGLLAGLIVLIRPTNILLLLYLAAWGVDSRAALRERLAFAARHAGRLLLFPLAAFVVFLPQFAYWKYISGDYLIYSYGEEGFTHWASPKIFHILFDVRNGWLLFSPVMVFALAGLYRGVCRNDPGQRVIAAILAAVLYLCASWWMWWFGGGFGYRPMVEFYALLAIPFAYYFEQLRQRGAWPQLFLHGLLLLAMIHYSLVLSDFKGNMPNYEWWYWRQGVARVLSFFSPG